MRHPHHHSALIIGAGAVGLGFASALIAAGIRVTLVARGAASDSLQRTGLTRVGALGRQHAPAGTFSVRPAVAAVDRRAYDSIYVCVKSYHSADVAGELAASPGLLHESTSVILCQNGWGNTESFTHRIGADRVLNARIMTGFEPEGPGLVRVTVHAGEVRIGSLFGANAPGVAEECAILTAGGLPALPSRDIGRDLWEKMWFNCTINPLGAICDATLGEIAESTAIRPILDALVLEFFEAMHAGGYAAHTRTPEAYLQKLYREILPATAAHRTSMLQDLRAGRRTEIDALNGVIVGLGDRHGLNVEAHRCVLGIVRFLTGLRSARAGDPDLTATGRRRLSTSFRAK